VMKLTKILTCMTCSSLFHILWCLQQRCEQTRRRQRLPNRYACGIKLILGNGKSLVSRPFLVPIFHRFHPNRQYRTREILLVHPAFQLSPRHIWQVSLSPTFDPADIHMCILVFVYAIMLRIIFFCPPVFIIEVNNSISKKVDSVFTDVGRCTRHPKIGVLKTNHQHPPQRLYLRLKSSGILE